MVNFSPMMRTLIILLSLGYSVSTQSTNLEDELFRELSENRAINPHTLPVQNSYNDTVLVKASLRVNHILGLDEARGVLTLSGWMSMYWFDYSFTWDHKEKYSSISFILYPPEKVWTPDLLLINSADAAKVNIYGQRLLRIVKFGSIMWNPPITVSSICDLDFTWFPIDEQTCSLIFSSWSYSTHELNLTVGYPWQANNLTSEFLEQHNEWEITSSTAKRISCFDYEGWGCLEFIIKLRRRASYYHLTFVIPCFVALMLTLAIFWFPPSSSEKLVVLSVTNIYLLTFLVHLYWVIPRSGNGVPGIVILSGNMAFFSGLALILSIVTQIISQMIPKVPLPPFISNVIYGWLGKSLCVHGRKIQISLEAHISSSGNMDLHVNQIGSEQPKVTYNDWIILATLIDRLCFLLYCLSYFIIIIVAFT